MVTTTTGRKSAKPYTTTSHYDERGRLTSKVPDEALVRKGEQVLAYSYPNENTRIAYRGASATTQSYDKERGWLNSVSGPNGTVSYSYNPEGQKLAMTAPSGTTGYGYDVRGRLNAISDQPSGATSATNIAAYAYDAVGNLSSLTRGNSVVTRYAYDEQNRLSDLVNTTNAGDLSRFHYTLRQDGKRTAIGESLVDAPDASTGAARSSVRSLAYTYDNAGKLTGETGQDGLGVAYQNTWNYDAVGNRTGATVQKAATAGATTWAHTTSVSAVFNANDQMTSQSSSVGSGAAVVQNFAYDQNGAESGTSSASGSSTNGWDFEGKLTGTALSDANGNASGGSANSFDAAGNRLARMSDVGKASQKTTSYLVDTDTSYAQVVEERAPDSSDAQGQPQLQARYVWGQGLAPLAMWRKMPKGSVKLFFYQTDGQESVRQLTSASGEVTDSYFYDAWGNGLSGGSGTTENPFRYTGQQRDPDGRYYLRARFYNPGNGRFLSHDPLMGSADDPASLHRYLYAGADAVNAYDPSGEAEIEEVEVTMLMRAQLFASQCAPVFTKILFGYTAYKVVTDPEFRQNFFTDLATQGPMGVTGVEAAAISEDAAAAKELMIADDVMPSARSTVTEAYENAAITFRKIMGSNTPNGIGKNKNVGFPNYEVNGEADFLTSVSGSSPLEGVNVLQPPAVAPNNLGAIAGHEFHPENLLAHEFERRFPDPSKATGVAHVYSERVNCNSCGPVLHNLQGKYPGIQFEFLDSGFPLGSLPEEYVQKWR